jgi:LPPG:FO 2-phospho-L-lactate transferase
LRTGRLAGGARLSDVTREIARALGVRVAVLPATDDPLRTVLETDEGTLAFQRYFVGRQCRPAVRAIRYENAPEARPTPEVLDALAAPDLAAVVICPSNPFLSVDPILAIPGLRARIAARGVPVIAVSPIIAGRAIKGPLARMMGDLGLPVDVAGIAGHYRGLADLLVVDEADRAARFEGPQKHVAATLMTTQGDRIALARDLLGVIGGMTGGPSSGGPSSGGPSSGGPPSGTTSSGGPS